LVSQKVDHEGKHLEIYFWDYHNKILHRPDALYKTNSVTQTLTVLKYVWSVFPAVIWHILFMSPPDQICPAIHSFIHFLPDLWMRYFENKWTDFAAGWHNWSTARAWNCRLWGSGGQRSRSHDYEAEV